MPEYRKPLDTRQVLAARSALVATVEEDRARAARSLPQRLANALPALRFVEVCEARPSFRKPTEYQDGEWEEEDEQPEAVFDERKITPMARKKMLGRLRRYILTRMTTRITT